MELLLNNESALPAFMFYPDDFTGDGALTSCSHMAIGVWMLLLCRMHKAPTYGTLTLLKQNVNQTENGGTILPMAPDKICRLVGLSLADYLPIHNELLDAGVMRFDPEPGVFFSKRMVKDHQVRVARRAAGAAGGQKTQSKIKEKFAKANTAAKADQIPEYGNGNEIVIGTVNKPVFAIESEKPKRTRRKKTETPSPEPIDPRVKTVNSRAMDEYFNFYKEQSGGISPQIKAQDGKALITVVSFFQKVAKDKGIPDVEKDNFIVDSIRFTLSRWPELDDFTRRQIDLTQIAANLNKIIYQIKQKHNERTSKTTGSVTGSGKQNPGSITDQDLAASISQKFGSQ